MTTTMDDLIRGYGDWIMRECVNGRLPYYINIMFHPLSGLSPSSIIPQIHNAIYNNFYPRAPRKIAAPPRTPQNRLRMILLRSRFDSWTFTPMMSAIDSESNFSRCPVDQFLIQGQGHGSNPCVRDRDAQCRVPRDPNKSAFIKMPTLPLLRVQIQFKLCFISTGRKRRWQSKISQE